MGEIYLLNGHGKTTKLKRALRGTTYADKTNEAAIKRTAISPHSSANFTSRSWPMLVWAISRPRKRTVTLHRLPSASPHPRLKPKGQHGSSAVGFPAPLYYDVGTVPAAKSRYINVTAGGEPQNTDVFFRNGKIEDNITQNKSFP